MTTCRPNHRIRRAAIASAVFLIFPLAVADGQLTISTWTGIPGENVSGVFARSANEIYASGGFQTLAKFDGNSWSAQVSNWANRYRVYGAPSGPVYSAGQAGYQSGNLLRTDGGAWSPVLSTNVELTALWVHADGTVFTGGDGRFFVGDGSSFSEVATGLSTAFNTDRLEYVWGRTSDDVYLSGYGGLYRYLAGAGFAPVAGTPNARFHGLSGTAGSTWAVGNGGQIWREQGGTWSMFDAGFGVDLYSMWAFSDSDLFVGGANGFLARYDGTSWTQYATGTTGPIIGMHALDEFRLFAGITAGQGSILSIQIERAHSVPEPAGLGVIAGLALGVLLVRRRICGAPSRCLVSR